MFEEKKLKLINYLAVALITILTFIIISLEIKTSSNSGQELHWVVYLFQIIILCIGYILFVINRRLASHNFQIEKKYTGIIDDKNEEIESYINKHSKKEGKKKNTEAYNLEAHLNAILTTDVKKSANLEVFCSSILKNIAKDQELCVALAFVKGKEANTLSYVSNYAYYSEEKPAKIIVGEGLSGQVAKNKEMLVIEDIPEDYITVFSGLGNAKPNALVILPIIYRNKTIALLELASFKNFTKDQLDLLNKLAIDLSSLINSFLKEDKENNEEK